MSSLEKKKIIKDYFIQIREDKFTRVKTIECKHKVEWKGNELKNTFMLTDETFSKKLSMSIDYRQKDEMDSIYFTFTYLNSDDGYPGMSNIKMYLILDENNSIELSEASGFEQYCQSSKVGAKYINHYIETAQLTVSKSDFIAIVNANKIEYSIRFGKGSLESIFDNNSLTIFYGFYNAVFDNEFKMENLYSFCQNDGFIGAIIYETYISQGKVAAAKRYQEITGQNLSGAAIYISNIESRIREDQSSDNINNHNQDNNSDHEIQGKTNSTNQNIQAILKTIYLHSKMSVSNKLYIKDNVDERKWKNFTSFFMPDIVGSIDECLLYYDSTIFGKGDNGFMITRNVFIWHNLYQPARIMFINKRAPSFNAAAELVRIKVNSKNRLIVCNKASEHLIDGGYEVLISFFEDPTFLVEKLNILISELKLDW